ncbi:helix-turn-helix domain-containing protein [Cyclobacterium marinum]|uniref:helix-turn-helix domain-containing protein n=1 Tax=Cyclobacterium marinum TaxID=104 RepID=UPI0030D972D8|tara:strand:+ start:25116 stop:25982 length:867 start_codon:yes stop_codon:yes gene_type:complete
MQEMDISFCDMGLFGDGIDHFWVEDLKGLLEDYPTLENPHKQDFYVLLLIKKAEGEVMVDNQKIRLDRNKAVVIKPRSINYISINREAEGKIICFTEDFFSLRYNNNQLCKFTFLNQSEGCFVRIKQTDWEKWELLLLFIYNEFKQKKGEYTHLLRSYLNIILFELDRQCPYTGNQKKKSASRSKIHKFEQLIDKHYKEQKLPSFYAEKLNVSANYLNRLCKEQTGLTAGDMIRKRIITEAKRLLIYTDNRINEIAYELGFESTSYFVTFFKKYDNHSPEKFRKKYLD